MNLKTNPNSLENHEFVQLIFKTDSIHFFCTVINITYNPALNPSSRSLIRSQTHKLTVWAYFNKSIGSLVLPPNSQTQ